MNLQIHEQFLAKYRNRNSRLLTFASLLCILRP